VKEKSCLKYKWGVANKLERLEVVLGVILFMTKEDAYAKVKKLIDVRGLHYRIIKSKNQDIPIGHKYLRSVNVY